MTDDETRPPSDSDEPLTAGVPADAAGQPSPEQAAPAPDSGAETKDDLSQLSRLAELREQGVITEKEFAAKKAAILGVSRRAAKPPRSRRFKITVAAILALLVLGGGGTAIGLKVKHDNDVQAKQEEAERQQAAAEKRAGEKKAAAEKAARQEAELEAELEKIEIGGRREMVRALRKSVTEDFEERVNEGSLNGPILLTQCDPVSGGIRDLNQTTGKYECLVATEELAGGRISGYPVDATINYTKGSYTWQMSG